MTTSQRSTNNGRPILDFKPLNMSLTKGTSVPTPLASPPLSPVGIARPPTPGGGPLSSHPATPVNGGSYFPPPPQSTTGKPSTTPKSSTDSESSKRVDSVLRAPLSPISPNVQATPSPTVRRRDSFGVRKLLSLSSLRNSLAGNSRTDLSLKRTNTTGLENMSHLEASKDNGRRPSSPSLYTSSLRSASSGHNCPPTSQSYSATVQGGVPSQQPQLRKRKSGSWFRRKSAIFFMEGDSNELQEESQETQERPRVQNHKHSRTESPLRISEPLYSPVKLSQPIYDQEQIYTLPPQAPSLPQVNALKGGSLTDGAFAGDDVFTNIGR